MLLRALGHTVYSAHDGMEAVLAAIENKPEVILLDIGLPVLNGYEVAKRMRLQSTLAHVVLIALIGYGQEADKQVALQAGFDHHLVKPARLEQIQKILASITLPSHQNSLQNPFTPSLSRLNRGEGSIGKRCP